MMLPTCTSGRVKALASTFIPRLDQPLLESLPIKFDDGAVRPDGAGTYARNVVTALVERDLHIGPFAAFFGKNLDAEIIVLMRGKQVVVPGDFAEENDGRRPGGEWLAGHLQFLGRNRLKALPCMNRKEKFTRSQ